MPINDVKYLKTNLVRNEITEVLLGIGKSINDYLSVPIQNNASIHDFFQAFNEGDKELKRTDFFVQSRLKKGRVSFGYHFKSTDSLEGELNISVLDNGENILQAQFNEVFTRLRSYVCEKGMTILDEGVRPEY
jgi:hypothetical protein